MNAAARADAPQTKVLLPFEYSWKDPDSRRVFQWRAEKLASLRKHPRDFMWLRDWYKDHPAQFITDWGCTYDPRNIERGLPAMVPFILFPKQVAWIDWALDRWRASEPGLTEKSRDCGVSWLAMALSVHLCLYYPGIAIGFGSQKKDKVDRSNDPDALFFKGRYFLSHLPQELRGGWEVDKHSAEMRLWFPRMSSSIAGEAGDHIGRGGRKSIYFLDEAAHLEHPYTVESSLLSATNCRLDLSSVAGMANPFAQKRHLGKVKFFTFSWRDDPRKDQEWYEKLKGSSMQVAFNQDVEIDYLASTEGQLIKGAWVQAAVGALEKLGIQPTGIQRGALDPADEGSATNAFAARHGVLLTALYEWRGRGSDLFETVQKTFTICDEQALDTFVYDADGIGAGVRGDARVINEQRKERGDRWINDEPFHGSGAVDMPEAEQVPEKKNKNFFANLKAQSWWAVRARFEMTYRAIVKGDKVDLDEILCLPAHLIDPYSNEDLLPRLLMELVQPRYKLNATGKVVIDKAPDGMASPNLADALMMAFNPTLALTEVWGRL